MPKVLDEDQLRRKKQLAEKRAARKKAKEEEAQRAAEQAAKAQAERQRRAENPENKEEETIDRHCYLIDLPEDAMVNLFQFLSAPELGRLTLTARSLHNFLKDARTSIVFSRLCNKQVSLVTTTTQVEDLLVHAETAGGDTGRIAPRGKYAKSHHPDFVSYAHFLEQAVTGYFVLQQDKQDNDNKNDEIFHFPVHIEGRFVSVSPEHSLSRVGGNGATGAGGSGVASWGVGKRGQLGHGQRVDQDLPPRRLTYFGYGGIRIVQVAAGGGLVRVAHSLILTSTGQVYSFGTGQYGALGHGYSAAKQLPDCIRPTLIQSLAATTKCIAVAAGELHSAALTVDGDLYTWGDGFCGQLGHGDRRPRVLPKQVEKGGLEDECIASVSCGSRHTIALTEEGEAFTFGLGHYGVLGRSYTPFEYDEEVIAEALGDRDVVVPAFAPLPEDVPPPAERDFAEELRQHLDLIANLSLEDSSDQCIPIRVESLNGIKLVQCSAGHRHTLLLDEHGGVFSCGAGTAGCLGHGDTLSQMYPVRITSFDDDNVHIRQLSAGVDVSMAVSTTGDVYAWGKPDGGRIGLGLIHGEVTHPRRVPVLDANGNPLPTVEVACAYVHSLIVAVDGTVHLCGNVGIEGQPDTQREEDARKHGGKATMINDFNIWHRLDEPKQNQSKPKVYKKYGKYEIKGRSKMLSSSSSTTTT